jgi:hypothetical protein
MNRLLRIYGYVQGISKKAIVLHYSGTTGQVADSWKPCEKATTSGRFAKLEQHPRDHCSSDTCQNSIQWS